MATPYSRKGTTDLSKSKQSKSAKSLGAKKKPVKKPTRRQHGRNR